LKSIPILLLIAVQTFLVFREQIFSPVDELAHTDYVRTIAEEGRLPIYGESHTDPVLLSVFYRQYPVPLTAEQLSRVPTAWSSGYESLQLPLYYLLAAPVYKVLDADPRTAIYGVRLLNVGLSALLLLLLILLLLRTFQFGYPLAAAIGLALLLAPGISLRNSQVSNGPLTSLLVTLLLYLLVRPRSGLANRHYFPEGATLGAAVLAKLTALGAAPAVALAWWRPSSRRLWGIAFGLGGLAIVLLPWLAWSLPVYGHPLPFMARHLVFWSPSDFALPTSISGWIGLFNKINHYFWFPWEWALPGGWSWSLKIVRLAGLALLAAGAGLALRQAFLKTPSEQTAACRLTLLMLAGLVIGYAALSIGLHRVWETDGRELYVFLGPLAILLGCLAVRLKQAGLFTFGALIAVWLVLDFGFYVAGSCTRCYP
jgi:hypothetical protein